MAERGVKVSARSNAFALCIGNSRYATSPLKNSAQDARDMAAMLRRLGFTTVLLLEASLDEMLKAVTLFLRQLTRGCVAVFFYAGALAWRP